MVSILPFIIAIIAIIREIFNYYRCKKAYELGYEKAMSDVVEIANHNFKTAKNIREQNEKLSDNDLDALLSGSLPPDKKDNG